MKSPHKPAIGGTAREPESPSFGEQGRVCLKLGAKLLRTLWALAAIYLLLSVGETGLRLITAQLFGHITNVIQGGGLVPDTWIGVTYFKWVAAAVAGIALPFVLKQVTATMDGRMANKLRDNLFEQVLAQPSEFFHENDPGRLTAIVNQMSVETQMTIRQLLVDPVVQLLSMILSTTFIVWNLLSVQKGEANPYMWAGIGLVFCFALLSPWLVSRLSIRLQTAATALREESLALAGLVNGALQSPEEIQAFRAEKMLATKHRNLLDHFLSARLRQTLNVQLLNSIDDLPLLAVQAGLVGFAIFGGVTGGGANPALAGAVVAILLQVPVLMAPIRAFSNYISMLRLYWPSIETVTSILDSEPRTHDAADARDIDSVSPELRVRDVSFSYAPGLPKVFQNLNFEAPAGKITALVAKMGQGKTTLFRLALRFNEPDAGNLEIGGYSPDTYTLESLRRHAVMMSQFPAWLHDTLRENMRIAKADASDEQIRAVCEQTGMWEILVNKMGAEPLDRQFGAGRMLSGGQKKLLGLSRCLLRKPMFLFLDEPTAGMDNHEKYRLIEPIRQACAGKTVIVVDHDIPWLMQLCEHFIVLDEGCVVQQGNLSEVLREEGLFKELAMLPAAPLVPLLSLLRAEGVLPEALHSPVLSENGHGPLSGEVRR